MATDNPATIYGLTGTDITWFNDFQATRDAKNLWVGGESFQCLLANVTQVIPRKGDSCKLDGWEFLTCNSVKVSNHDGDLALVTVEYSGLDPDAKARAESGGDFIDRDYTFELGIVTSEEPIETHSRYKEVPTAELHIIQEIKNGKLEKVDRNDSESYIFAPINDTDGGPFEIFSDLGKELLGFILKGVESYLHPYQIWRATFVDDKLPDYDILNAVGYITSAIKAPNISNNRNWLFNGLNVIDDGGIFTITYEWQLSLPDGWEEKLYLENPPA